MDAATKETYEKTKLNCNFDNVISNLKKIIEYKRKNKTPFPHITFRYVILKDNVNEIPQFLELINSIANPEEWGGSSSVVEFTGLLYFEDIKQYYVEKLSQDTIDEILKHKDGIEFVFAHAEEDKNPPIEQCTAWLEPYIMLPGYVMPCCAIMMSNRRPFLRKYSFGNVLKDKFENIWNNEYYTKFKRIINDPTQPVPSICAGCRAYRTQERMKRNGVWDVYNF
jgi:MoaA/NifB/PqqE/SkfB family radical SAM enzyme